MMLAVPLPARLSGADPWIGEQRRHYVHGSRVQREVGQATRKARLTKRVTGHTFRRSFATHPLPDAYDARVVQELLGHKDVRKIRVHTDVMNQGGTTRLQPGGRTPPTSR